jgi:hypothetical protein
MDHVAIEEVRLTGIPVGSEVEVRRRFDQAWARGFTVFEHDAGGYRLRRLSDGAVLPVSFPEADLRLAELSQVR